ncbi:MAG: hypothetical protein IJM69_10320 [Firmicutes bacterium]|nr:hypothetical protein [Bacillota bacterium]
MNRITTAVIIFTAVFLFPAPGRRDSLSSLKLQRFPRFTIPVSPAGWHFGREDPAAPESVTIFTAPGIALPRETAAVTACDPVNTRGCRHSVFLFLTWHAFCFY